MPAKNVAKKTPKKGATANTVKAVPKGLTPWKPGQSGNPAGRPRGISLATVLASKLTQADADAIVQAVIKRAKTGDLAAWSSLIERTDGKVPNRIQHGGDPDNEQPITLTINRPQP